MISRNRTINFGAGGSGLSVRGAINFTAPADETPKSLVIDLTAAALHPRLTYTGPQHYYWDAAGKLALSAANEWPVEYIGGVAVGRHEPEPAATNIQVYSRAVTVSDYLVKSDDFSLVVDAAGAPDGGPIGRIPVACNAYLISQDVDSVVHVPQSKYAMTDNWQRLNFVITSTKRSRLRLRYGQAYRLSVPAVWITQGSGYADWPPAGNYAISWFAKNGDGVTFPAGFAQMESGALSTSPIVNETTDKNTRQASSVTVATSGYQLLRLVFNNGSSETHTITGGSFSLPLAPEHWGQRYIAQIELEA